MFQKQNAKRYDFIPKTPHFLENNRGKNDHSLSSSSSNHVAASILCLALVGLEGDLEYSVAQGVSVEGLYSHQSLIIIRHGDETEPLALVGLEISDHLDRLDCSERTEQLPQKILFSVRRQVVDENAPSRAAHGIPGEKRVRQEVASQWRVPAVMGERDNEH